MKYNVYLSAVVTNLRHDFLQRHPNLKEKLDAMTDEAVWNVYDDCIGGESAAQEWEWAIEDLFDLLNQGA